MRPVPETINTRVAAIAEATNTGVDSRLLDSP